MARRLADRTIDRVLCSTSTRAMDTAAAVAHDHGLELEAFVELCETGCGDLDGRGDREARDLCEDTFSRWLTGEHDLFLPGGESWTVIRDRMMSIVDSLPSAPWSADVVLVGHGGSIRVVLDTVLGGEVAASIGYPRNTGCIELIPIPGGGWELAGHDPGVSLPFDSIDHRPDQSEAD